MDQAGKRLGTGYAPLPKYVSRFIRWGTDREVWKLFSQCHHQNTLAGATQPAQRGHPRALLHAADDTPENTKLIVIQRDPRRRGWGGGRLNGYGHRF